MRIGTFFGGDSSVATQVQHIVDADADGFDSVWFGQVFGPDSMTVIAIAGERTSRIEIGTAVVPTFTRHPYVMAQQALTVQAATASRFVLGIGLSHKPVVEAMWGMSYDQPARHMQEYLSVMLPLLRDGRVTFSGEVYRTAANVRVPDATPLPVVIAALAPRMLKIAGELPTAP